MNIYAPNNDDPSFFRVVSEKVSSFECDLIVFGGDFNLVCDIQKDKKGGAPTRHWKSREEVLSMVAQHSHSNIMQETAQMIKKSSDFIKNTFEISIKVK